MFLIKTYILLTYVTLRISMQNFKTERKLVLHRIKIYNKKLNNKTNTKYFFCYVL